MTERWEELGDHLAESLRTVVSTRADKRRLNNRLIEFAFQPPTSDAAPISVVVSAYEVIISAGQGTRFELGRLPESSTEAIRLVGAVAAGRLTEFIEGKHVRFQLQLEDGSQLKGRSTTELRPRSGHNGEVTYASYHSA